MPVLSEVEKMECDLAKMKDDMEEVENGEAERGLKRKRSMDETPLPAEESYIDPDLDDLVSARLFPSSFTSNCNCIFCFLFSV